MNRSRALVFPAVLALASLGAAQSTQQTTPPAPSPEQQQTSPPTTPPGQSAPENPPTPAPAPPQAPVHIGPVIVLDPEHGGPDEGARGSNGMVEKDLVLRFAQMVRAELERQGYRVVMTRNDDSDPSYDDRNATANVYRDMVYISLHVSTTGTVGTVRAYYYSFWSPIISAPAITGGAAGPNGPGPAESAAPPGWIPWQQAQRGYTEPSHRLADALQSELSKQFSGSPAVSSGVEVRELRSVAGPAATVEVSSVLAPDPATLTNMSLPLATAIVRGIQDFRPRAPQGGS